MILNFLNNPMIKTRSGPQINGHIFFWIQATLSYERGTIITAVTITSGERNDGKELQTMIEKRPRSRCGCQNGHWRCNVFEEREYRIYE